MLVFLQHDFNGILIEKKGKEEKRKENEEKEWKRKSKLLLLIVSKLVEESFSV